MTVLLASEENIKIFPYLNLDSNLYSTTDDIHSALKNVASKKPENNISLLLVLHFCKNKVLNTAFSHIKFSITVCAAFGDHISSIVNMITKGTLNHIAEWLYKASHILVKKKKKIFRLFGKGQELSKINKNYFSIVFVKKKNQTLYSNSAKTRNLCDIL